MVEIYRSNGAKMGAQISLCAGNRLNIKLIGFGPNRKHWILRSTDPALKVVPLRVDERCAEQRLRLDVAADGIVSRRVAYVEVYVGDERGRPLRREANGSRLAVEIVPALALPDAESEAGLLARMLIVESAGPEHVSYRGEVEALLAMQWMRHVLVNRFRLGTKYFGAAGRASVQALITADGQVEGFERYPLMEAKQKRLLEAVVTIANDGADVRYPRYRAYLENALKVALGKAPGTDPSSTGLYAWRTEGARGPGRNFVMYGSKGGQDFYGLTESFLEQVRNDRSTAR
jgi:hypothetical protein